MLGSVAGPQEPGGSGVCVCTLVEALVAELAHTGMWVTRVWEGCPTGPAGGVLGVFVEWVHGVAPLSCLCRVSRSSGTLSGPDPWTSRLPTTEPRVTLPSSSLGLPLPLNKHSADLRLLTSLERILGRAQWLHLNPGLLRN